MSKFSIHIPMSQWGIDHYSTLAYLETRCVDHDGVISKPHMRCDPERHPQFAHVAWEGKDIPSLIAGGKTQHQHDDYDCVQDMVTEGLLEFTPSNPPSVKLTDFGMMVVNALRNHKASGGNYGNFSYSKPTT